MRPDSERACADPPAMPRIRLHERHCGVFGALVALFWVTLDLADVISTIRDLARSGHRLAPSTNRFSHPQFPGEVNVKVVAGDPAGGPLPLFLALHGGGENEGHWSSGTDMFTGPTQAAWKRGIFVCPSVLHKKYAE